MTAIEANVTDEVTFVLNGVPVSAAIDLATTAFDLLRHEFRLTSVRSACDGIADNVLNASVVTKSSH